MGKKEHKIDKWIITSLQHYSFLLSLSCSLSLSLSLSLSFYLTFSSWLHPSSLTLTSTNSTFMYVKIIISEGNRVQLPFSPVIFQHSTQQTALAASVAKLYPAHNAATFLPVSSSPFRDELTQTICLSTSVDVSGAWDRPILRERHRNFLKTTPLRRVSREISKPIWSYRLLFTRTSQKFT